MGLEFGIDLSFKTPKAVSAYTAFCEYNYISSSSFFSTEDGCYIPDVYDEDVKYPITIEACYWRKFYSFYGEVFEMLGRKSAYITNAATLQDIYNLLYKYTEKEYFDMQDKEPYYWDYYEYLNTIYKQLSNLKKLIGLTLWLTDEKEGLTIASAEADKNADIEIYFYFS